MKRLIFIALGVLLFALNIWRYEVDHHDFNLISGVFCGVSMLFYAATTASFKKYKPNDLQGIPIIFYDKKFISSLRKGENDQPVEQLQLDSKG